ncbi:mismatch-specific DNA-glycosylase [Lederbergia sp. NSJ-179]|uniref:mismatch-specific DNA-glycosylase n=1 Tax=Lederbergia sp. NSJ-179 TaxID=2931402 RepID=UPI001FD2BB4F|nr:mismatch-specific DNA-glycosylase [Lederbergia sp. NSJ-179]MCJ7842015.1 mismatch-specific DNA-glycosylase [Lederbergia sp. NSJ-179]
MKPVPDDLKKGLKLLFVGFNPSIRSSETGHHYANPTNKFWKVLFGAGLTERLYDPGEGEKLLKKGFGFTNIVPRPTRSAAEITKEEYQQGKEILVEKIRYYKPKVVCFVGKGVYLQYSGKRKAEWGPQPDQTVPGVIDFVAPSTSGLVRMTLEEMKTIYRQLQELIDL